MRAGPRIKKTAALTIRMTQQVRERLDASARVDHISVSEAAENLLQAGMFWRAFQRTVMAEADATPTDDEIKAAFRTIEALKARAA